MSVVCATVLAVALIAADLLAGALHLPTKVQHDWGVADGIGLALAWFVIVVHAAVDERRP